MPRPTAFTHSDVVDAALSVVERQGLVALKARAVAEALGASVAPVYKQFANMEELTAAAVERAIELLLAHARREWTEGRFLNMGTGIAIFARDHTNLYRLLFLDSARFRPLLRRFMEALETDLGDDPEFTAMPEQQRGQMLETMWTVTHGLAARMVAGLIDDDSDEAIVAFLQHVGGAVIARTWLDAGVPPEEVLARLAGEANKEGEDC